MEFEFTNNISRVKSYPVTIGVAVNNACNVDCVFCLAGAKSNERIGWEQFAKLENVFEHVSEVIFAGQEVILHPDIWKMFELLSKKGVFTSFFSNGKALNFEIMESLVEHRVGRISCSFHGATPETYESIVRGVNYDRIVQQFEYLNRYRSKIEARTGAMCTPHLDFHYVMMRRNLEELSKFLEIAAWLGAQNVIAKFMMIYGHLKHLEKESLYFYPELTNRVIDHCVLKAKGLPLSFVAPKKFDMKGRKEGVDLNGSKKGGLSKKNHSTCSWPWRQCNISTDGNVTACCGGTPAMGNIYETTFEEIWNNEKYVDLRATVNTPNQWPECRKCHDVTTSSDSDNIKRHLLYISDDSETVTSELIDTNGIFTNEEELFGLVLDIFDKSAMGTLNLESCLSRIAGLISPLERDYLFKKRDEMQIYVNILSNRGVFVLLVLRFFNNFNHSYVAYRFIEALGQTSHGKHVTGQSEAYCQQVFLEKICSQFAVGYYSSGIEEFKRCLPWIKELLGIDETNKLIKIIQEFEWKCVKDFLNNVLEVRLISLNS